jgi:type III secretion protein U
VSEKTEEPTPRRRRRARQEGDSPASAYAAQALAFLVAIALVPACVSAAWAHAAKTLQGVLSAAPHPTLASLVAAARRSALGVLVLTLPLLAASGAAGALAQGVQTQAGQGGGGVFAFGRLVPKLERLDLAAGSKRLFSSVRLFAVARAFAAGGVVGALAYAGLSDAAPDLAHTAGRVRWIGAVVSNVAGTLLWRAAWLGLLLGAVDMVVMHRAWLVRNRMSKDEVKRELKESEGDPLIKAARERAHRELLTQATIAGVRSASVVVINPAHLACALRYDERAGDGAPVVVAAGEGDFAAAIVRAARASGVPVVRDVPLARALVELSVGDAIPEVLYEAVAEILREVSDPTAAPDA